MTAESPVVLLTGANRGTGLALATRLHALGRRVWALNRTPAGLPWLNEVPCDLGRPAEVAAAVAHVVEQSGRLDAVVANGVVRALGEIGELPLADWQEAVDVNLTSVIALVQAALPALRTGGGRIVLMGSHAGSMPFEGGAAYCATKAALKAVAEVLLLEERRHGVRTTLINAGAIANLPGDDSPVKVSTASVAEAVCWVLDAPEDMAVGELELRPGRLPEHVPVRGLDRLQAV